MNNALDILKKYFGYDTFRPGQSEIIATILEGRDVLAVMPTGSGKSLCYQIPALMGESVTIVISPLLSLMHDQVNALCKAGVNTACINSMMTVSERRRVTENAAAGMYKIIYVAPERLLTPAFREFAGDADISAVVIDEAHCVSEWGHDFRRSYLDIKTFVGSLKRRPVVAAFTATATERVKKDIAALLGLENPVRFTFGCDRPGLYFGVVKTEEKFGYAVDFIRRRPGKSGIIYCATRRNADTLCESLIDSGIDAVKYHAGLSESERNFNQDEFISNRCRVIVATNAFGMGIDKPDVSYVIHFNMPLSIEAYYQEAGRAGRDGRDAECVLLFSERDVSLGRYIIANSRGTGENSKEDKKLVQISLSKLRDMASLCRSRGCVRANILSYFGEKYKGGKCGKCSSCLKNNRAVTLDTAEIVIGRVIEENGQRYGERALARILAGKKTAKYIGRGSDKLYETGQIRLDSKRDVYGVIEEMTKKGLLIRSRTKPPVFSVSSSFSELYPRPEYEETSAREAAVKRTVFPDRELLERLRKWRKEESERLRCPQYAVLSDLTLYSIACTKPQTYYELLKIKGMIKQRADKYGEDILFITRKYKKGNKK